MASKKGLGAWLEDKAEGPAYAIVFVCMASRAASFYSDGALALRRLLGEGGLAAYNAVTGLGIAVGSGLVMSVAGRQWRGALAELIEVEGRKGLSKAERSTLRAYWQAEASKHFKAMCVALALETAAALFFFWTGNTDHSPLTFLGETFISVAAVFISFYFGVLKDTRGTSPKEEAQAIAHGSRLRANQEAGRRIADGQYTRQDVFLVAQDLPKHDRAGFIAALVPGDEDDPTWTVQHIMDWLGTPHPSIRRKVYRLLGKLSEKHPAVVNDPAEGWRLPRSAAHRHLMPLFLELRGPATLQGGDTSATPPRQLHLPRGQSKRPGQPLDATATGQSDAGDTPATSQEVTAPAIA